MADNRFDILDFSTHSGTFSAVQLPALTGSLFWNTSLLYTLGVISVEDSNFLAGDFNRDNHVTAADILPAMKALTDPAGYESQYSVSSANLQLIGDMNGDTKFTNSDLQALLDYLKDGGGSINSVPEPASWVLASVALAAILWGRLQHSKHRNTARHETRSHSCLRTRSPNRSMQRKHFNSSPLTPHLGKYSGTIKVDDSWLGGNRRLQAFHNRKTARVLVC